MAMTYRVGFKIPNFKIPKVHNTKIWYFSKYQKGAFKIPKGAFKIPKRGVQNTKKISMDKSLWAFKIPKK